MAFEHIERLKAEYTDKYVVIDEARPELLRFKGFTGTVRTVNMSGRALVEFDGGDNNIGWFDIDVDYLKVIDEPLAKPEPVKKAKAKPAAKKDSGGAKKPAAMSTADILAAARGGAAKPAAKKPAMSAADVLAAARGEKAAPKAEKPAADPKKMSVEDILAAARANKPTAAAPADEPTTEIVVEEEAPAPEPEPESVAEAPAAEAPKGDLPTDIPGILDYCRKADAG